MAQISEFISVHCPFDRAGDALKQFLSAHAKGNDGSVLALRVRLAEVVIEREVEVTLRGQRDIPAYTMLDIEWAPEPPGPFPTFKGTISVSDEAPGWCRLDLYGDYTPPGGPAGAAFDAALGNRIARMTATELLERLKSELEKTAAG